SLKYKVNVPSRRRHLRLVCPYRVPAAARKRAHAGPSAECFDERANVGVYIHSGCQQLLYFGRRFGSSSAHRIIPPAATLIRAIARCADMRLAGTARAKREIL